MRKRGMVYGLALWAATQMACAATGPVTAGFDDIDAAGGDVPLAAYLGLNWSNIAAYTITPGFAGFDNGIVSPANGAYGGGENAGNGIEPVVSTITALPGQRFDFLGASFGAGYYDGLSLTVTGWRDGGAADTDTLLLDTTGAQAFSLNFTGLDALTFATARTAATADPYACGTFNCTQFTIDNARFVISAVPAPPGAMMLLAGLALLIPLRHRRA